MEEIVADLLKMLALANVLLGGCGYFWDPGVLHPQEVVSHQNILNVPRQELQSAHDLNGACAAVISGQRALSLIKQVMNEAISQIDELTKHTVKVWLHLDALA